MDEPAIFQCGQCQRTYATDYLLRLHQRRVHWGRKFHCYHCNYTTNYKNVLTKHVASSHLRKKKKSAGIHTCPLCNLFKLANRSDMLKHYESVHNVSISQTTLQFSNNEDFLQWKREIELRDSCQYVATRGDRKTSLGDTKYLRCSRDGFYRIVGKGERRPKLKGSIKTNAVCPSLITVRRTKLGILTVKYVGTHVGHTCDIGRLQLCEQERNDIAQKLAANVPVDAILDSIRESMCDGTYSRLHLTTRKDLINIKRRIQDGHSMHSNDRTSVEAWIKTVANYSNIVRFYKPQSVLLPECALREEDFVLILAYDAQLAMLSEFGPKCVCLDGTHGTNAYDFELTTILVKDDKGQGFPCAFLISNRADTEMVSLFVSVINRFLETPFSPQILMTDMSEIYYNAWSNEMPKPVQWLFCSWHVDRAWRKNLNKISDVNKRCYAYKLIRTLMDETDETVFEPLMEKVMKAMAEDEDLRNFSHYFATTYSKNFRAWAFCYRKYTGINTNMMLESMHKIIKYIYLQGKKVKRLDKGIAALLKFVRDKLYDALITKARGKLTPEIVRIRQRHDKSATMNPVILPTKDGWVISSESKEKMYEVKKMDVTCDCIAKCGDCDICVHDYQCSCVDSMKLNICKHIHSIVTFSKEQMPSAESPSILPEEDDEEPSENLQVFQEDESPIEMAIVEDLSAKNRQVGQPDESIEKCREILRMRMNQIIDSVRTVDDYRLVLKAITPIPHTLEAQKGGLIFSSTSAVPKRINPCANVSPQKSLFSTKKKRTGSQSKRGSLSKPTEKEKDDLIKELWFVSHENIDGNNNKLD